MLEGINPNHETHKDTKKMLFSLRDIIDKSNPEWKNSRMTYLEFLKDPWQKTKTREVKDSEQENEYLSMIKFIELTEVIIDKKKNESSNPKLLQRK